MTAPNTRPSLILRIRDPKDSQAWEEFSQMYRPVVYRLALGRGLQPADAEDLTQQVLFSVSKAIDRFEVEPGRAKFRTWLRSIARNAILNILARDPFLRRLDSPDEELILQSAVASNEDALAVQLEYRREAFLVAASQIQAEFQPKSWQAFWRTTVDEQDIKTVAKELQLSVGSVYAARCRIIQRLRQRVERLEGDIT